MVAVSITQIVEQSRNLIKHSSYDMVITYGITKEMTVTNTTFITTFLINSISLKETIILSIISLNTRHIIAIKIDATSKLSIMTSRLENHLLG